MPRRRRFWGPGAGAHAISRFVDRRFYLVDDADRQALLDAIGHAHARWDWRWLSYALMSSHVHYGHVAGVVDPDRFFRSAHGSFAQRYHRRRERRTLGPVFADRPAIHPVHAPELSRLVAYHHRNPVEAGVVERPSQSTWTSHRAYVRLDAAPPWLDVERALSILGFRDTAAGRRQFDEFVTEVDLRDRPWESRPGEPSGRMIRQGVPPVDWARLLDTACGVVGVDRNAALSSRRRDVVATRWLIGVVATRDLGQPYSAAAAALGLQTGSLFNLLNRTRDAVRMDGLLVEFRRRLRAK